jgi:DNA-binding winged helix-turn-helix (wHTH) protein
MNQMHSVDELLADGVPVPINSRALDVRIVLVAARRKRVTVNHLLSRIRRKTVVEKNTLRFISTVRKAMGEDFSKTIHGRDYRFVVEIAAHVCQPAVPAHPGVALAQFRHVPLPTNLSASLSNPVGHNILADLCDFVEALVGQGGVDRTRLGLEAIWRLLPSCRTIVGCCP